MEPIRILVVEDDQDINRLLCTILNDAGYFSQSAFSGSEAMLWAEKEGFDLVLLDLMLPGLTGEEFIAKVRQHGTMPIIVLSAKAGVEDRVKVLRLGADDFIPKPFDNQEVLARVEAQLRRVKKFSAPPEKKQRFVCGDLCLDREEFTVTAEGNPVTLTAREFEILALLMEYPQAGIYPGADLSARVGRGLLRRRQHGQRAHQQPALQAGQGEQAGVYQDRVGHWL